MESSQDTNNPVAWCHLSYNDDGSSIPDSLQHCPDSYCTTPLYTAPPERQPHNLNCTVFVYRHRETGAIRALYTEGAYAMTGRDDYEHVASLEPRMWIEYHFDEAAKERQPLTDAQIKGLIEEGVFFGNCKEIVRAIEAAHGIGGQQ